MNILWLGTVKLTLTNIDAGHLLSKSRCHAAKDIPYGSKNN